MPVEKTASKKYIGFIYIYMCVCVCVYIYINIISMYSCRKNDGIANKNDLFMEKSLKMTLLKQ